MPLELRLIGVSVLGLIASFVLGSINLGWVLGTGVTFLTFLIALATIFVRIKIVPESERWVIERFGKAKRAGGAPRIFKPGLHILFRWIDKLRARQSLQEQLRDTEDQTVLAGGVQVRLQGAFYFCHRALEERPGWKFRAKQ